MRHTITLLVDNESGVLSRIAGLFSAAHLFDQSANLLDQLEQMLPFLADEGLPEQVAEKPDLRTED